MNFDADLDPESELEKMDRIFLTKQNFQFFCLIFLAYFYAKT